VFYICDLFDRVSGMPTNIVIAALVRPSFLRIP